MPINQAPRIVRVTWMYDLLANNVPIEQSQHSVCYQAEAVPGDDATIDLILHDMADAANASQVAHVPMGLWCNSVWASKVRVALEGTDGKTLNEQFSIATGDLAWRGSNSAACLPWEVAFCYSLYAHQIGVFDALGKSKRGRFYLPPPSSGILESAHTGEVKAGDLQTIADSWATVLLELQEHNYSGFPGFSPTLVVNSRRWAAAFPVVAVRVDAKLDTQRRRQKKEPAAVIGAPFPPA